MADLRDIISDHLSGFEKLVNKIPGYKGYKEKEMRREADMLLRHHLAQQLGDQLGRAEDVTNQMLVGPGLAQLDEMGQGNTRLQTFVDKVKTAAQGYAGFFDAVKVKEEQLDTLYEFDQGMLAQVDEIAAAIDAVQAALDSGDSGAIAPAVRGYVKTVSETSSAFDKRKDTILGLA
jgi:hypothetical protein